MKKFSVNFEYWFEADPDRVFAAWTDPEIAGSWIPGSSDADVVTACAVVEKGGQYRYSLQVPDYDELVLRGAYREVERPKRLVYSLTWDAVADLDQPPETNVTVAFEEQDGRTRLHLVHENLRREMVTSVESGWVEACNQLAEWMRDHRTSQS